MAEALIVASHWHYSVENVNASTDDFYKEVSQVLQVKKAPVKVATVEWRERSIFSSKRRYLRVSYQQYVFDICAAPFGNDFFWSWWLGTKPGILEALPYVGFIFRHLIRPDTYHTEDTRQMFQDTVHRVVLDVVSGVLSTKQMSPLSAHERLPTQKNRAIGLAV